MWWWRLEFVGRTRTIWSRFEFVDGAELDRSSEICAVWGSEAQGWPCPFIVKMGGQSTLLAILSSVGDALPNLATLNFPGTQTISTQMRYYRHLRGRMSYRYRSKGHIRLVSDSSTDMQARRVGGHEFVPWSRTSGISEGGT